MRRLAIFFVAVAFTGQMAAQSKIIPFGTALDPKAQVLQSQQLAK
jgi:hypothetical protein